MKTSLMPFAPDRRIRTRADADAVAARPLAEQIGVDSTYALFAASAEAFGDAPAFTFLETGEPGGPSKSWSYAELFARITQTANALHRRGVGPEDAVSILLPGCLEYHLALWGGAAAGIAAPLNPLLTAEKLAELMRAARAKVLICYGAAPYLAKARAATALLDMPPEILVVAEIGHPAPADLPVLIEEITAEPSDHLVSGRRITGSDIAAYFHTGGTTGSPKLALHTHGNHVFSAWATIQLNGMGPTDRIINGYPLFHVAGVLPGSLAACAAGVETIIPTTDLFRNRDVIRNYWRLAAHHQVTVVSAVPTILSVLADLPTDGLDVSRVRYCRTGAAPLPPDLAERFETAHKLEVIESYGMTESAGIISVTPPGTRAPAGCVGLPVPHGEVRIAPLGAEGRPGTGSVPEGETGAVLFRAPNMIPGYLDPAQTAEAFTDDGWLITGDLGFLDPAGMLHLSGRAKDVIIRGGHNIDPAVIEAAIDTHPAVHMSAAVGEPDGYAGEVPVVFAVLAEGAEADAEALASWTAARVDEGPARPKAVHILDTMPVTNVGKIYKPELRRLATAQKIDRLHGEIAPDCGMAAEVDLSPKGKVTATVRLSGGDSDARGALAAALRALPLAPHVEESAP
ncbi:MAG: AMP-binding protein [Pseudomonadota bacterium]